MIFLLRNCFCFYK